MLVLTVRDGECIEVNGPAKINFETARPCKIKLGIEAPPTTTVVRPKLQPLANLDLKTMLDIPPKEE